jgi:hypothetical protein
MNEVTRRMIGIVFNCLSFLAVIFSFIFFMRMQEDQSMTERYRSEGTVSRAVVTDKKLDKMVTQRSKGRSTTTNLQILYIRYAERSPVKYADFPARIAEKDLPGAPPQNGDASKDSSSIGVIFVPRATYEAVKVGDTLIVVDTPYSGDDPELIDTIKGFDPSVFYPRIAIALTLGLMFGLIGLMITRPRVLKPSAVAAINRS